MLAIARSSFVYWSEGDARSFFVIEDPSDRLIRPHGGHVGRTMRFEMTSARQQQVTADHRAESSTITRNLFGRCKTSDRTRHSKHRPGRIRASRSATWQDIQGLRGRSVSALADALDGLSRLDLGDRDRWVAELRELKAAVESRRAKVDEVLHKPRIGGSPELNDQWISAIGTLAEQIDALTNKLSSQVQLTDAVFDQMMAVKHLAWIVRSDAGLERLLFGNAIAGAKVSVDWQRKITELHGCWRRWKTYYETAPKTRNHSRMRSRRQRNLF